MEFAQKTSTGYLEKASKADGEYIFIGSTEHPDRDGDVIRQEGWDTEDFQKNPVVFYNHDYRGLATKFPIGTAKTRLDATNKRLLFDIKFAEANPDAQMVKALVDEGVLRAVSVGFMPKAYTMIVDPETQAVKGREFTKQSLLEISVVALPANAQAVRLALSKGLVTAEQVTKLGFDDAPILPGTGSEGFIETITELRAAVATLTARVSELETKTTVGSQTSGSASVSGVIDPVTDASGEDAEYCEALLDLGRKTAALFQPSSEAQASAEAVAASLAVFRK